MVGWAIYPTPKEGVDNAFQWMCESADRCGISLEIIFAEELSIKVEDKISIYYRGEERVAPCFALMRHYDDTLSLALESAGVRVYNSSTAMRLSRDKFLTHLYLLNNNIPTPKTIYRGGYEQAMELSMPFIFKCREGSKGEEVFLVDSKSEFSELSIKYPYYIVQEYISESYGSDIRVWVVGGVVVAATERFNANSFKSNLAGGGVVRPVCLTHEIEQLAIDSCAALGVELGGVDILRYNGGYTVCEVNGNAGFRAFSAEGESVDIPFEIFSYISNTLG